MQAEFFDDKGGFLDEATLYLITDVKAGAKDHFKISIISPSKAMTDPTTKMIVKVAGGHSMAF